MLRLVCLAVCLAPLVLAACGQRPELVIPFDPSGAEAQLPTVTAALRDGDPATALAELDRLAAAGPLPDGALHLRGLALVDAGRSSEARAAFEQELALHPGNGPAHALLARLMIDAGQLDQAAAQLEEARRLAPDFQPALLQAGRLAMLRNDDEQAQRCYRDYLSHDPYGVPAIEAHTALSQIAARRGPAVAAEAQAHAETAANLRQLHDYLGSYEARLRHDPGDTEAAYGVATAYLSLYVNMGHDPRLLQPAEEALQHVLELAPGDARALYNLGFIRIEQRRFDEALDLSRRAVAARPDYAPAHLNLGALLERMGSGDEALAEYETALACARPDEALRARFELVRCLAARSSPADWQRALDEGRALLELDPQGTLGARALLDELQRRIDAAQASTGAPAAPAPDAGKPPAAGGGG